MRMLKVFFIVIICFIVTACNSGNSSSTGGSPVTPNINGDDIIAAGESTPVFSEISCLNATITTGGQITLKSNCPQPVILSNISLVFKAQDVINHDPVVFDTYVNSIDGNYALTFETLSANKVGALLSVIATPDKDSNTNPYYINTGSSIIFNSNLLSDNKTDFDAELATNSVEIIKPTDHLELLDQNNSNSPQLNTTTQFSLQALTSSTGALDVGIDTRYAGCGQYTNCSNLMVNVLNSDGQAVATVRLPESQIGKAYVSRVNNLPYGTYSLNAPLLPNAQGLFDNNIYTQIIDSSSVKPALQLRYQSTVGKLVLHIHTNQAKCNKYDCNTINVGVVNSTGVLVARFNIPNEAIGGTFNQIIDGLPQGLYNFNGYSSNGFAVDLQPTNGMVRVDAQRTVNVDMNFREPTSTGTVTVRLGRPVNWNADLAIPLNFQVYNTVTGTLVLTSTIKPGESKIVSLAISDATHKYQAFLTQGFASPENNSFYMQTAPVKFNVTAGGTNIVTLAPIANASEQKLQSEAVIFNVNGLRNGDSVQITANDSFKKFAYGLSNSYSKAQAESLKLYYQTGALIAARVKANGRYQTNPKYTSIVASNSAIANIQFSESNVAAVFDYVPTFNYVYDSLIYIPVNTMNEPNKYFGLNTYVVTNITSGTLSNPSYESASLPAGISIDSTRTTCNKLPDGLAANQTCLIAFKYAPTVANVWSSFPFLVKFTNEDNVNVFSSVINIPYSSRSR